MPLFFNLILNIQKIHPEIPNVILWLFPFTLFYYCNLLMLISIHIIVNIFKKITYKLRLLDNQN
jgi:hypothetical protein